MTFDRATHIAHEATAVLTPWVVFGAAVLETDRGHMTGTEFVAAGCVTLAVVLGAQAAKNIAAVRAAVQGPVPPSNPVGKSA